MPCFAGVTIVHMLPALGPIISLVVIFRSFSAASGIFDHHKYDECMSDSADPHNNYKPYQSTSDGVACSLLEFEMGSLLGKGNYATVYHATRKATGQEVAIKQVKGSGSYSTVQKEVCALVALSHPAVPKLYCVILEENTTYLVMEFISGTDLLKKTTKIPAEHKYKCIRQVLVEIGGLVNFLHEQKLIFGDLKPENIMVSDHGSLYLIDYGFASKAHVAEAPLCTLAFASPELATLCYSAPRVKVPWDTRFASDWYALGVMVYELSQCKPLISPGNRTVVQRTLRVGFASDHFSGMQPYTQLLAGLLHRSSDSRWSWVEVQRWLETNPEST